MKNEAGIELIQHGGPRGNIASRLLANKFDVKSLRSNDVLLYDEWKEIDKAVLPAAQSRLVGIADLQSRGLVYTIPNGLSKTVLAYQDASDIEDAVMNMDGLARGQRDRPQFDTNYLPLPIIHYDFSFSVREINEARAGNMPLDTSMAEFAARKVAEKAESVLFTGSSSYTFGGGTIYGYNDFTHINSYSLAAHWNDSAATGETILADVIGMKQASITDKHYGPWVIYIGTTFEAAIDADFKAASDKSIRQRLLEVSGIQDIKVCDWVTTDTVLMVQMTSDNVRLIDGMGITTIQWDTEGGMRVNFKVMCIWVPQLRADQNDTCGIVKGSK